MVSPNTKADELNKKKLEFEAKQEKERLDFMASHEKEKLAISQDNSPPVNGSAVPPAKSKVNVKAVLIGLCVMLIIFAIFGESGVNMVFSIMLWAALIFGVVKLLGKIY
jgi:hypothetical protein